LEIQVFIGYCFFSGACRTLKAICHNTTQILAEMLKSAWQQQTRLKTLNRYFDSLDPFHTGN